MQPTERFTNRVDNYVKYRPGYPDALVRKLESEGLAAGSQVVDVACGTGISTELFLRNGYRVTGIEPNAAMREAALSQGFDVREGRGEATGLPDASADLVVCAQAFHWVDAEAARREFLRIVKPGGLIAIIWNIRLKTGSAFLEGLERLLVEGSPEYAAKFSGDKEDSVDVDTVFLPLVVERWTGPNEQVLDWQGLKGRLLSASYVPVGDEGFLGRLRAVYDRHQVAGMVRILYECRLYWLRAA
ncbi:class I SAM-dependent methyltransferase [uncultured Paludibaculum sp.]|uniref:class I SAM-dependent methyltransferase n=1 Tax=uncultured Paludibaculum sp. TaxID=1765020 RepID=UPI002AAADC3E|nr:class I SAM-dependent methyltransferase [uncultured Paludibaculum sp.]